MKLTYFCSVVLIAVFLAFAVVAQPIAGNEISDDGDERINDGLNGSDDFAERIENFKRDCRETIINDEYGHHEYQQAVADLYARGRWEKLAFEVHYFDEPKLIAKFDGLIDRAIADLQGELRSKYLESGWLDNENPTN